MSQKFLYLFISLILSVTTMAQTKQDILTLDNLIPGGKSYSKYTPENIKNLHWVGSDYIYQKGDSLLVKSPKRHKSEQIITIREINQALTNSQILPLPKLPSLVAFGEGYFDFKIKNRYCRYDIKKEEISYSVLLNSGDTNLDWDNSKQLLALTNGNNLYVVNQEGEQNVVAESTQDGISYGTYGIHRNEFGISNGTFWSPQSTHLAFYRLDQRKVSNYPLVDIQQRVAKVNNTPYPMAGMSSESVKVGVYNLETQKTIYLKLDTTYCYQTNVTWSPDNSEIYIQELNREQNKAQLVAYSATTGKRERVLFTETDPHYVEPLNKLTFVDNNSFIYQSRKDGYNHLYLYDTTGKELKQITKGEWEVTALTAFDAKRKELYIEAREASPLESNLYKVSLKSGEMQRITQSNGTHYTQISSDYAYIIDRYSNHSTPQNIEIIEVKSGDTTCLLTAKDPFAKYEMPEITTGTLKAADGETDLYYRLLKPTNFDAEKQYPVVVYVYGGPHAQMITNSWNWGARGWDIYMAQRGYVVFTVDGRGSAYRGAAFEQVIHRQLGVEESKDQMCGIEFLKTLPYVDANRIGVHGWSFGGFMTTNLMLRHPETFKVGVAGGAVIDWKYYEVMYGERYMDTPKENKEGYQNSSLLPIAGELKGRLLLVHCDTDPVVVWQHTLMFLKKSIEQGGYPDYFVYPGHEHNVSGIERVHLHEKITRYFDDFLK